MLRVAAEAEASASESGFVKSGNVRAEYEVNWLSAVGVGVNGKVFHCRHKATKDQCVVKFVRDSSEARVEVFAQRSVTPHPNIVGIRDVFAGNFLLPGDSCPRKWLAIVLELCPDGELFYYIKSKGRLPEDEVRLVALQLASACKHMHSKGVIHRDIKPENILLVSRSPLRIKIADFGFATIDTPTDTVYTPNYVAPEVLRAQSHLRTSGRLLPVGPKIDLWAVGVVTYTCFAGFVPFYSTDPRNQRDLTPCMRNAILNGWYELREAEFGCVSTLGKQVIADLLQVDPESRLSAAELARHPWFDLAAHNNSGSAHGVLLTVSGDDDDVFAAEICAGAEATAAATAVVAVAAQGVAEEGHERQKQKQKQSQQTANSQPSASASAATVTAAATSSVRVSGGLVMIPASPAQQQHHQPQPQPQSQPQSQPQPQPQSQPQPQPQQPSSPNRRMVRSRSPVRKYRSASQTPARSPAKSVLVLESAPKDAAAQASVRVMLPNLQQQSQQQHQSPPASPHAPTGGASAFVCLSPPGSPTSPSTPSPSCSVPLSPSSPSSPSSSMQGKTRKRKASGGPHSELTVTVRVIGPLAKQLKVVIASTDCPFRSVMDAVAKAEPGLPIHEQQYVHSGFKINMDASVAGNSIADGDTLFLTPLSLSRAAAVATAAAPLSPTSPAASACSLHAAEAAAGLSSAVLAAAAVACCAAQTQKLSSGAILAAPSFVASTAAGPAAQKLDLSPGRLSGVPSLAACSKSVLARRRQATQRQLIGQQNLVEAAENTSNNASAAVDDPCQQ